jgi:hypothetical protein
MIPLSVLQAGLSFNWKDDDIVYIKLFVKESTEMLLSKQGDNCDNPL